MGQAADLNPRIIEALYAEGLVLSDEVRAAFDLSRIEAGDPEDLTRVALSCEALRTTTRMMHAIAWLLNHRAYFRGECLRRWGDQIVAANWDSLVFDIGVEPLRRVSREEREQAIREARAQAAMGVRVLLGGGDCADNRGPVYGPKVFRDIYLPRLKTAFPRVLIMQKVLRCRQSARLS